MLTEKLKTPVKIALTGGISCGKSQTLKIFQKLGYLTLEADKLIKKIYQTDEIIAKFTQHWGKDIISKKKVNLKNLAKIIFNSKKEMAWLKKTIYPILLKEILSICPKRYPSSIIEIPLLFENNWQKYFDFTICVWANDERQKELLKKRQWTQQNFKLRQAHQINKSLKLQLADFGIINHFSKKILQKQCKQIVYTIRN